jgi:hypothetical protein
MVNDKFQVRTTGPVDPLTRQPVKVSMAAIYQEKMTDHFRDERGPVVSDSEKWNEMLLSPTERLSYYRID